MNKNKFIALALATTLCVPLSACSFLEKETTSEGGEISTQIEEVTAELPSGNKHILIYSYNEDFKEIFEDFYLKDHPLPDGYTYEFVVTPKAGGKYQSTLDNALEDKEKIDIFLVEPDYAMKYINSDITKSVTSLGISSLDLSNQYAYTTALGTSDDGVLKGLSWQIAPGAFVYRRSIAKEILGTDEPQIVSQSLDSWDKFNSIASEVSKSGKYKMLAGYDDSFRVFQQNSSEPWVDDNLNIQIPPEVTKWVEQTKTFTLNGFNNKAELFSEAWISGQTSSGNVFGYFLSPWGVEEMLANNSLDVLPENGGEYASGNGIYGDWAIIEAPQSYYWGGSWLCASKYADDIDIVSDIFKYFTTETTYMTAYSLSTGDLVNNKASMSDIISGSNPTSALLDYQNSWQIYNKVADNITCDNRTPYDQYLNEEFQKQMHNYFNGTVEYNAALNAFYAAVHEVYPELKYKELPVNVAETTPQS